jgi:protein dithiol:quinone oxidoreductase
LSALFTNPTRVFGIVALISLGGVAAAMVSQHIYDMQPCPWCVLQRLIFVVIGLLACLGLLWRSRAGQFVVAIGLDLLATLGIVTALWQHFVAAASQSCNLTLADKIMAATGLDGLMPDVFAARASCADAAVNMLGVPYEFWSLALFATVGALAVLAMLSLRRPRPH